MRWIVGADHAGLLLKNHLVALLRTLDEKLAQAPWLGGDAPSLVDFELWPWLTLLAATRRFDDLARVADYWERVAARPSHRTTNPY